MNQYRPCSYPEHKPFKLLPRWTFVVLLALFIFFTLQLKIFSNQHVGVYRFADGRLVSIVKCSKKDYRYCFFQSGLTGRLYRIDQSNYESGRGWSGRRPVITRVSFVRDQDGYRMTGLKWEDLSKEKIDDAQKLKIKKRAAHFFSVNTLLNGKLFLPAGKGPFPAVIVVQGSGKYSIRDYFHHHFFFAANGVAALVFDKRGTGLSKGQFTFNFYSLAGDVMAAAEWLNDRPEIAHRQIGLAAYSQGGWVAPLAAARSEIISFMIINYGMIDSPLEEEKNQVLYWMKRDQVDEVAMREATQMLVAANNLLKNQFKKGWKQFRVLKKKYKKRPWIKYLEGSMAQYLLKYPRWVVKLFKKKFLLHNLPWNYSSDGILETLHVPVYWFIAGEDSSAPNQYTVARVKELISAGQPHFLKIYAHTEHGICEFSEKGRKRRITKYAESYFPDQVEAVKILTSKLAE